MISLASGLLSFTVPAPTEKKIGRACVTQQLPSVPPREISRAVEVGSLIIFELEINRLLGKAHQDLGMLAQPAVKRRRAAFGGPQDQKIGDDGIQC